MTYDEGRIIDDEPAQEEACFVCEVNGRLYLIKLAPYYKKTLLVTCPDFPEVTTFGRTKKDALRAAFVAIDEAIYARNSRGEPLPPSRRVRP